MFHILLENESQGLQFHAERQADKLPSAIMTVKLSREQNSHSGLLSSVAELPCVDSIQELIS